MDARNTNTAVFSSADAEHYEPHPIANLFPKMETAQLAALTERIEADRLLDEIVLFEGKILDGRARYLACLNSGKRPRFREFNSAVEGDPASFVVNKNLVRKHYWQKSQRAMIAARLVTAEVGFNQHSQGTTNGGAAALLGVSRRSVERAKSILDPDIAAAVADGRFSTGVAHSLSELPPQARQAILAEPINGLALKKAVHRAVRECRRTNPAKVPEGRFAVIVSDPPWEVDKTPYSNMTVEEIDDYHRPLLDEKADGDCRLFLWTTMVFLPAAMKLIQGWGWKYEATMVWHKPGGHQHPDRSQYNCEFVVVATKGSPGYVDTRRFPACFCGEGRDHSRKPDEFFEMVKRTTAGPRLELFARRPHDGFAPHGNEIDWSGRTQFAQSNRAAEFDDLSRANLEFSMQGWHFDKWIEEAIAANRQKKEVESA